MKKYKVHDNQGCNFMDYTHEEPWTGEEIREHLIEQTIDQRDLEGTEDGELIKQQSLEDMVEIYDITLEEVKPNFINDEEKMFDFHRITKEDFLNSYSYLTEEEYEETRLIVEQESNNGN